MRFYIPPNLQRNFSDSLEQLGIESIVNFNPLSKVKVRLDKTNYKTKNNSTTADEVVFAELTSNLKMGDYLQYKNEVMLINQLKENEFPNCYEFTTTTCNAKLDIMRYQKEEYNNEGNIIHPEGDFPIVTNLYCSTLFNNFQFKTANGSVGIVPENQLMISCQFNNQTNGINIGDKLLWFESSYRIINLDFSQVDINQTYGILTFYAEKVVI